MVKLETSGRLLEPSWGHIGSLLGFLGAILGPLRGSLEAILGAFGALSGPS